MITQEKGKQKYQSRINHKLVGLLEPRCQKCNRVIRNNRLLERYKYCNKCLPNKDRCMLRTRHGKRCYAAKPPNKDYCNYHADARNRSVERTEDSGYVYFMCLGFDDLYKLGRAKDVGRRIKELSSANPRLKLVTAVFSKDNVYSENLCHKLLEKYHYDRELFKITKDKIDHIIKLINKTVLK